MELYEQVAGTTDETKKYYTMYNTLQNTKDFISKECKVMDRHMSPHLSLSSAYILNVVLPVSLSLSAFATISPKIPTRGSSLRAWRAF